MFFRKLNKVYSSYDNYVKVDFHISFNGYIYANDLKVV